MIAVCLATVAARGADDPATDFYERIKLASVEVLADDHLEGSGWIAQADGIAVTAAHVVRGLKRHIEIISPVAGRLEAQVLAVDRGNDCAILKLPAREGGYPSLPFADVVPHAGAQVYLFGSPLYRHALLNTATVARNENTFEFLRNNGDFVRVVHLTGFGAPGSSGGPWLNGRAEVIGLNSGMIRDGNAPAGIGFMVPLEPIRTLVKDKHAPGTATAGTAAEELWEQPVDRLKHFAPHSEGVVLRVLNKEGPAGRAGFKELDLIVAIDGKPVRLRDEFVRFVRSKKPGDEITFKQMLPDKGGFVEKSFKLEDLDAEPPREVNADVKK